jgi:hypothetical protein
MSRAHRTLVKPGRSPRLDQAQREKLLLNGWMAHDARWYAAVAQSYGIEAANRLNATAVHETGKVEARRALRLLGLDPPTSIEACVIAQEAMAQLLAPGLVDYTLSLYDGRAVRFDVTRCFAHENVTRAGIASQYRCGIFPRLQGWWDVFDIDYELTPEPGPCMKVQGQVCTYTFSIRQQK